MIRNGVVINEFDNTPGQQSSRAGDPPTDRCHRAGELHAGDLQGARSWIGVETHRLEQVGAIQRRGVHVDEDLVRTELRIGDALDDEGLGTIMGTQDDSTHRPSLTCCAPAAAIAAPCLR